MDALILKIAVKNAVKEALKENYAKNNTEIRKGNKALQIISNMMFYGQYYKDEFQVLESKPYSERAWQNWKKKYGFE